MAVPYHGIMPQSANTTAMGLAESDLSVSEHLGQAQASVFSCLEMVRAIIDQVDGVKPEAVENGGANNAVPPLRSRAAMLSSTAYDLHTRLEKLRSLL